MLFSIKSADNTVPFPLILKNIALEIEKSLHGKVMGIEKITKSYGASTNNYFIKVSYKKATKAYFLKLNDKEAVEREGIGTRFIENYLPTPRVILLAQNDRTDFSWILFEYISGELMVEKFLKISSEKDRELFLDLEEQKEKLLNKLHSTARINLTRDGYIKARTNRLFYDRLFGERYKTFFAQGPTNISSYFDHRIVVNNKKLPQTINQIFDSIREKYSLRCDQTISASTGQGDAHHGNIIINENVWFIDHEYADFIPPFMELAKPYYNDLIGTLFFHHHKKLTEYFRIDQFEDTGKQLILKVGCPKILTTFIEITKIKIRERRGLVNTRTKDFISLNDYLILSHTLTKNPNTYPAEIQLLFILYAAILSQFDPFEPESIYTFF